MVAESLLEDRWLRSQVGRFVERRGVWWLTDDELVQEACLFLLDRYDPRRFDLRKARSGRSEVEALKAHAAVSLYHHLSHVAKREYDKVQSQLPVEVADEETRRSPPDGDGLIGWRKFHQWLIHDPEPRAFRLRLICREVLRGLSLYEAADRLGFSRGLVGRLFTWARDRYGFLFPQRR